MAHCDEYVELISTALDGALSPEETARLEAHLNACPECRALYADLERVHRALLDLPPVEVPAGLTDRILEAVAKDNITPLPKAKQSARKPWRSLATAAVLFLVLAGAWGMSQGLKQPTKSAPEAMTRDAMAPSFYEDEDAISTYSVQGAMIESAESPSSFKVAGEPPAEQNTSPADQPGQMATDAQNTETVAVDTISPVTEGVIDPEASVSVTGSLFVLPASGESPEGVDMEIPGEGEPDGQDQEPEPSPSFTPAEALALVVERCFGNSGYEMVREDLEGDPLSCHVFLTDGDTSFAGGTIVYTGETEEFYLFECHWDDDPEEPYHYSVHKTEGYVAWAGDVIGEGP